MSFTQMGIFAISSYPYSLKLFWSPIVDSVYSASFGRRKSWVVPIQLACGALLVASARWVEARLALGDVWALTALFFVFVLLAATQVLAATRRGRGGRKGGGCRGRCLLVCVWGGGCPRKGGLTCPPPSS